MENTDSSPNKRFSNSDVFSVYCVGSMVLGNLGLMLRTRKELVQLLPIASFGF